MGKKAKNTPNTKKTGHEETPTGEAELRKAEEDARNVLRELLLKNMAVAFVASAPGKEHHFAEMFINNLDAYLATAPSPHTQDDTAPAAAPAIDTADIQARIDEAASTIESYLEQKLQTFIDKKLEEALS